MSTDEKQRYDNHEPHELDDGVHDTQQDILPDGVLDPVYQAKAHLLNEAIQETGMGWYQWQLFVVTGFGWFADNLWPVVTGLILTPVIYEFKHKGPFLKLGQNIGLLIGAGFWGLGSDIWGRKVAFNTTLLLVGVFGTAAGGSPNFTALTALAAVWSIGVGGNLPVDSALFLEFVPGSHQYLLTVLSIWWAFGQLVGALIAWPLIANHTCTPVKPDNICNKADNMGWRYFLYTMGGLMLLLWIIRFFVFTIYESPKFLMSRGRDAEAVEVVHAVAARNGRTSSLTLEHLTQIDARSNTNLEKGLTGEKDAKPETVVDTSRAAAVRRQLAKFDAKHIRALFATRQLAWSTTLIIIIWALIGLAFPLYNAFITYFLQTRGADFHDGSTYITYRNQVIIAVLGVPGSIIGGVLVEVPLIGRKGTLSISTLLTGVFLYASTTARTSNALLGWNCGYSFTSNLMYGVLYAYTPEVFPAKDRGTGTGLAACANRIFGIMSPIIALYADLTTAVPIYISGALFIFAGFLVLLLPYEPRGKASM